MESNIDKAIAQLYLIKKGASIPETSFDMSGELYKSKSGWILLSVPNSLVRGAFDALNAHGAELPPSGPDGRLNAHISVMRPEELAKIGGPDKITERGKHFSYRIKGFKTVSPSGWDTISKVWMLEVHSPDLEKLRKSYGLSACPNANKFEFHITVAVRKKNVLRENSSVVKRSDALPGGLADDLPDEDFDMDQLEEGTEHELEHTNDEDIAEEIAKDHLTETPVYYDKLPLLEKLHAKMAEEDQDEEDADEEESEEESKPRIIMQSTTITISTRGKAKIPKELEDMFCKKSPGIPEELEEILRGRGV